MNQREFEEMIDAYVLGALDANDRIQFERFLRNNEIVCKSAMDEIKPAVRGLLFSAPAKSPAAAVRLRIMSQIKEENNKGTANDLE